jgi:hypothetical protein
MQIRKEDVKKSIKEENKVSCLPCVFC